MAVKMQEDYRIGDYVGTFGLVCSACDDFYNHWKMISTINV